MDFTNINKASKVIEDGLKLLPEDALVEWMATANKDVTIAEAIDTAKGELEDATSAKKGASDSLAEEKAAMLNAYAIQEANRMATTLWRLELLTDELEKEFRALPSMSEVAGTYNAFLAARDQRMDEVAEQGKKLQEEKRGLEIFMGIINGVPVEESEQQYDEFKSAQKQALTELR